MQRNSNIASWCIDNYSKCTWIGKNIRLWSVAFSSSKEGNDIPCPNGQLKKSSGGGKTTAWFMCLPVSRLFWVSSLAYPNLLGTKGYVVVVVVWWGKNHPHGIIIKKGPYDPGWHPHPWPMAIYRAKLNLGRLHHYPGQRSAPLPGLAMHHRHKPASTARGVFWVQYRVRIPVGRHDHDQPHHWTISQFATPMTNNMIRKTAPSATLVTFWI
jgi:hypothetical protein